MGLFEAYVLVAGSIAVGLVGGAFVPRMIRAVPEPESAESGEGGTPKELYIDIAKRRGLTWKSALGAALAAGLIAASVGWPTALALVPLTPVALALAVIDLRTRLLPRIIVLPATAYLLTALALVSLVAGESQDMIRALIGLVAARTLFWLMWKIHAAGMGFGDVRLAALIGLALGYLGWSQLFIGVYAGFLLLGLPGFAYALIKRDRGYLRVAIPFGPFMLAGSLVGIVVGPLVARYLGYA